MSTKALLGEQPQGIGSILGGSEFEKPNRTGSTAASLRRTLSADMSSKKWLLQHGFSPLKRIASSEELLPSSDDIWNSNQSKDEEEEKNKIINEQSGGGGGGQYDMWSSILTQKPSSLPPPYVHPLVKRSKSSLTGKSLEICTENLGSDSGSDGFSTYSPSEISSNSDDDDDQEEEEEEVKEESEIVDKQEMAGNVDEKVNYCSASSVSRKSPPRSFPPPLPSLSRPGLHIRPRREDGRLVLQAITVPSQNYFHAQRQDGRLLLTFIKSPSQQQQSIMESDDENEEIQVPASDDDDEEEEDEGFESENEEEEEEEEEAMVEKGGFELEMEFNQQLPTKKLPIGVINVHRSAVMVNKLIGGLAINRNPNWSHKLEKMVQMEVDEEEANDSTLFPQSLPSPPPRKATTPRLIPTSPTVTSSFNTYEYCWRRKPSSVTGCGIMTKQSLPINNNIITSNNNNNNFLVSSRNSSKANQEKQQQFVVKRGGDSLLAPLIKSCKEPRRSLLSWEPYCIATS